MNRLQVLGRAGHTEISWDPKNPEQVAAAKAEFDQLKEAGFLLFVVTEADAFPAAAGKVTARLAAAPATPAAAAPEPGVTLGRGKRGKQTREFDANAPRTVAVAPMRGGA